MLDADWYLGITRDQRDASACPRLHERHPDMRPIAMPGCTVAGHRNEAACVRPYFDAVMSAQQHL
ncbi:Uncharacterised protein [Mycobacterium tuberculosis]|uniref:Uncharacterized protein n=1 Tax=Mycobacterium tuberculosis TaxID=1773 RepID=A0A916LBI4_MYCTX|nr:Uncharacterised protein [Mycobacterium tuberculosis]COY40449.1 Uncharacterised protein [Mycobacterium tuberculosis]COY63746.1 Uncharacterised protein [Mycobacterium tuberculosis]